MTVVNKYVKRICRDVAFSLMEAMKMWLDNVGNYGQLFYSVMAFGRKCFICILN